MPIEACIYIIVFGPQFPPHHRPTSVLQKVHFGFLYPVRCMYFPIHLLCSITPSQTWSDSTKLVPINFGASTMFVLFLVNRRNSYSTQMHQTIALLSCTFMAIMALIIGYNYLMLTAKSPAKLGEYVPVLFSLTSRSAILIHVDNLY